MASTPILVDYKKEETNKLKQFLLLTEQERAFLIAREIFYAAHGTVVTKTFIRFACVIGGLFSVQSFAKLYTDQTGVAKVPRNKVYALYIIVILFIALYFTLKVHYERFVHRNSDRKAARLSQYYTEGGVSYYEKLLGRNNALRNLLNEAGQKLYTIEGNETSKRKVQTTERRDKMKEYLDNWNTGKFKIREKNEDISYTPVK